MHSKHLIHNYVTGYLILIYYTFSKILGQMCSGAVSAEYHQDSSQVEHARTLADCRALHCMALRPCLLSVPPPSTFSKLEQSQIFQEDSLLFTIWEPREVRMWPHTFQLSNTISSHVGNDWISSEAPPCLPSISYPSHTLM